MLGKQALRVLAIGAETRNLPSGAVLFYAGELADGGYVVQEGSLLLEPGTPLEGKEITVGPGTLIGELALLTDMVCAGDRHREGADGGDPHFAQPVPQDAGRLSGRRARNCATSMAERVDELDARARRREEDVGEARQSVAC